MEVIVLSTSFSRERTKPLSLDRNSWWKVLTCNYLSNGREEPFHTPYIPCVLRAVHKYLGGGAGKFQFWYVKTFLTRLSLYLRLFWPPFYRTLNFLTPLPMYPKLFWPPTETFWEWCCQESWISDYFCYFDVLSNYWCSQTNLKKNMDRIILIYFHTWPLWGGQGKELFWRIGGIGATYTDSFIWAWIHTT